MASTLRTIALFLVVFGAQAAAVVAAGVVLDPDLQYPHPFREPLAYNDRAHKIGLYKALDAPPDALVLGGSTVSFMPSSLIGERVGGSAFNFALPGAGVEESLAIYEWTRSVGPPPKVLIVGLVAYDMNGARDLWWQPYLSPELEPYLPPPPSALDFALQSREFLNIARIRSLARFVMHEVSGGPVDHEILPDGTATGATYLRRLTEGTLDPATSARETIAPKLGYMAGHDSVDERRMRALERLVSMAREDGASVIVVHPPFHPAALELLDRDGHFPRFVDDLNAELRGLCAEGVVAEDLTRWADTPEKARWFHDEWHFVGPTAELMVDAVLEREGSLC